MSYGTEGEAGTLTSKLPARTLGAVIDCQVEVPAWLETRAISSGGRETRTRLRHFLSPVFEADQTDIL
jgi:hypothetical protein